MNSKSDKTVPSSQRIPHLLKYMGAKREILDFVTDALDKLGEKDAWVCDLFAGTSVVSGSLKSKYKVHSNDIQSYSRILAMTYLSDLKTSVPLKRINEIKVHAEEIYQEFKSHYPKLKFDYKGVLDLNKVVNLEKAQQDLINYDFKVGFHLFTKYYSGTYWSFDQCIWIDSIRCVAEMFNGKPEYYAIIAALISAMSYVSQSTGHYAQYRDVNSENLNDILTYRNREIWFYFEKKFNELLLSLNSGPKHGFKITTLDYLDCLRAISAGTIVYADPPYQSVHYSRFYHAIETLVRYDYPKVSHKGRYREDRHQSPFCKKTTVVDAFNSLFKSVEARNAHLALSYSDTGMISLTRILQIAHKTFKNNYEIEVLEKQYNHSTMGRSEEKHQEVTEYIILFKKI